jgi:YVTN family beta-propeller protein
LRKALGREAIVTQAPGYLVTVEPGALDVERFEALVREAHGEDAESAAETLREALAQWRGPALADLGEVARAERVELEEQRASALEQRIEADLELGRHAELVPELEALVREDPLRERRRAQLMLALYRSGRQADALEAYRRGRKLLADELGLEPGGELRRLEKAILEQDPALAPPPPPPESPTSERPRRLSGRHWLVVGAGAVLLACAGTGLVLVLTGGADAVVVEPNSVAVVDPATGRIGGDVPIGGRPVAIAIGEGAVWVVNADSNTVVRIDPKTRKVVATIGGLGENVSDVAVGFGSVWVAGGNNETLIRIDPRLNAPEAPVDLGSRHQLVPQPVFLVATGAGSVWATRGNRLLRVDPETNEAQNWLGVRRPQGLAAGPGAVWVSRDDEHVLRIDATTPKTTADQDLSELPQFPVWHEGALWLIGYGAMNVHVWHLDSTTLTPENAVPFRIKGYPYELAGGRRALWTVSPDTGFLWRIDAPTGLAKRVARIGHHPVSVAAGEGAVWVGTQKEKLR